MTILGRKMDKICFFLIFSRLASKNRFHSQKTEIMLGVGQLWALKPPPKSIFTTVSRFGRAHFKKHSSCYRLFHCRWVRGPQNIYICLISEPAPWRCVTGTRQHSYGKPSRLQVARGRFGGAWAPIWATWAKMATITSNCHVKHRCATFTATRQSVILSHKWAARLLKTPGIH